jgi:hypothetical protein
MSGPSKRLLRSLFVVLAATGLLSCGPAQDDPIAARPVGTGPECTAGLEACVCDDGGRCDPDLVCNGSVCEACLEGTDGCACMDGSHCDDELVCGDDEKCRPLAGPDPTQLETAVENPAPVRSEYRG